MANKRQLKKAITYACGEMAGECYFAQNTFENTNPEDWDKIVLDIAMLQVGAIKRVSVDFDKIPKDFHIGNYMKEESEKIVGEMNSLVKK